MGILLILLGLVAAGVVADFVVENDLATAPDQTVGLFGGSFRLSTPEVVLGAAVLGALSVLLVILGVGFLRGSWGRRRALKRRVANLEQENAAHRAREDLATAADTLPSQESQGVTGEPR
ncbi:MAG: LapA family protein [Actinomycetota bacterium]